MILRSLELKSFGRFNDKTFEFRRGMNLVVGANEAGKSTMMASIAAVLFGVRDKQRYQPWGSQQGCQAALQFESQQSNIRLERDVVTDQVDLFQYDGMYHLIDHFSARIALSHHPEHYQHFVQSLRHLLGIGDESLFRATQFVGQGDFPSSTDEFERFLRTILSGFTQGDSEMVLRSLKDDYDAISSDNPWSGTSASPRELEVVCDALQEIEARQQQNDELLTELEQLRRRIALLKNDLEEDRVQLREGLEYVEWIQQQWQLETLPETCQADTDPVQPPAVDEVAPPSERQQLEQTLRQAGIPVPVPENLTRLLAEADDVRHQMVGLQSEIIPFRDRLQKVRQPDWKRPLLLMLLMIVAGQTVSFLAPSWTLSAAVVGALASLAGWGWYGVNFTKISKLCRGLQEKIAAIELRREQEQQRLTALDDEFEALGVASSAVELVKIQKAFERHRDIFQRLSELSDPLEESGEQQGDDACAIASEPEELRPTGEGRSSEHLQPEDLPEAQKKLEDLEQSIRSRESDLLALVRHEAVLLGRLAEGEPDARHREQLERRLSALKQRKQVLGCAVEVLQQSLDEFHTSSLQCFEKRIGKYLRKATQNKYSAITIEQDFSARLKSRNGQWVALEQLSRGTMDAVCLAIRLGLSHFMTPGKTLPFFLDDVLINLDGDRLQESVAVLERLSSDHQIILFSHDERLHKIAARRRWHVIALSERRSRTAARNKEGAEDAGQLSFL